MGCGRGLALGLLSLFALLGALSLNAPAAAQSWGGLYNMDSMLAAPHPFAQPSAAQMAPSVAPPPAAPRAIPASQPASPPAHPAQPNADYQNTPSGGNWSWTDMFSEVRLGALMHDTGPFSSRKEGGADANVELLFASPKIFSFMWSPRPMLGVSYSASGDTSYVYAGLNWEWSFWGGWFAGFSFGGMVHDGHLVGDDDNKSLGCRALFRESIDFGYRFKKRHAIMAHVNHSSNASLCEKNTPDGTAFGRHDVILNEGLESVGIRYGYSF